MTSENFSYTNITKIENLTTESREVNVIVKVASKSEVRTVSGGLHRVADVLVGDETGCVYLTLWDDHIDQINEEDTLSITNGYVRLFRGSMRLNIGRYGSFEILEASPITEINTQNNLSLKRYEQRRYRTDRPRYGRRQDYRRRY